MRQDDASAEPRARKSRLSLYVLAGLLGLFAVLTLVVNTPLSRPLVQSALRGWIHPDLQVQGAVSVGLFPALSVSVKDVVIAEKDDPQPLWQVASLQWQVPWTALWSDQLVLSDVRVSDVIVQKQRPDWSSLVPPLSGREADPPVRLMASFKQLSTPASVRTLSLDALTVDGLTVIQPVTGGAPLPLLSLARLTVSLHLTSSGPRQGDAASGLQGHFNALITGLTIEESALDGVLQAWLEQLALGLEGVVTVERALTNWNVQAGVANLAELEVVGPWGRFFANTGTASLTSGEVRIPMRAQLTSGIMLNTPGLQVRAARTDVELLLTGTIGSLGIESPATQAIKRISR